MRISDQTVRRRLYQVVFIPEDQWEVLHWTNGTEAIAGTGLLLIKFGPLQNGGMSCLLTRPGLVWDRILDVLGFGEALEDTRNTWYVQEVQSVCRWKCNVLGGNNDRTSDPSNSHLWHFDWSPIPQRDSTNDFTALQPWRRWQLHPCRWQCKTSPDSSNVSVSSTMKHQSNAMASAVPRHECNWACMGHVEGEARKVCDNCVWFVT